MALALVVAPRGANTLLDSGMRMEVLDTSTWSPDEKPTKDRGVTVSYTHLTLPTTPYV